MTPLQTAAALTVSAGVVYAAGHARLLSRLLGWADAQTTRPAWHPLFLLGAPIVVAALALAWLINPGRAADDRRQRRAETTLTTPLPGYDLQRNRRRIGGPRLPYHPRPPQSTRTEGTT
ncbi:hypothetical protein [Streptomyces sp. NPDC053560]|uniref:hypothetical protein n=1 Tax=Streptomyces sp. NPDC053560 TaxID=3365711 RepID=UPI0037D8EA10